MAKWNSTLWWVHLTLVLVTGLLVIDHQLTPELLESEVVQSRAYQERATSYHGYHSHSTTTINANLLELAEGTILQLSGTGDLYSVGDTLELARTPILDVPLQYRKKGSRERRLIEVGSNTLDYRIYPYAVLVLAFVLLWEPRWEGLRWTLQAGFVLMLVCWLLVMIGTGAVGRLIRLI